MNSISACLDARYIARYGLRRGAYDGASKRRFVLFASDGETVTRHEFDTKDERDAKTLSMLRARIEFEKKCR